MSLLRGPFEARLLAAERIAAQTARDQNALKVELLALEQGVWDAWNDLTPNPAYMPTPSTATYSGAVSGCTGGLSGIVVTLTNHATSAVIGTVTTTTGGAFSGAVSLTGSLSVDFTASATNFVTATTNATLTAGSSTGGIAVNLTAATGYICVFGCNEPVSKTLTVTDSAYGSYTATYQGIFSGAYTWQTSGVTVSFPGGGGCSAVGSVPVTYTLANGGSWASKVQYVSVSLFNPCPASSGSSATSNHVLGSAACPPSFAITFGNAASQKYYGSAGAGSATIAWN